MGRSALRESIKRRNKGNMLTVQLTNTFRVYETSIGLQQWPRECQAVVSFGIHVVTARTDSRMLTIIASRTPFYKSEQH
jgi:hypothetical protein